MSWRSRGSPPLVTRWPRRPASARCTLSARRPLLPDVTAREVPGSAGAQIAARRMPTSRYPLPGISPASVAPHRSLGHDASTTLGLTRCAVDDASNLAHTVHSAVVRPFFELRPLRCARRWPPQQRAKGESQKNAQAVHPSIHAATYGNARKPTTNTVATQSMIFPARLVRGARQSHPGPLATACLGLRYVK